MYYRTEMSALNFGVKGQGHSGITCWNRHCTGMQYSTSCVEFRLSSFEYVCDCSHMLVCRRASNVKCARCHVSVSALMAAVISVSLESATATIVHHVDRWFAWGATVRWLWDTLSAASGPVPMLMRETSFSRVEATVPSTSVFNSFLFCRSADRFFSHSYSHSTLWVKKSLPLKIPPHLKRVTSLHCLVQYKFSKFALTAVKQRQIFLALTEENVAEVDKLVLR